MEELDLKELFRMFWNKKLQILLLVAISIAVGGIYTINCVTPEYKSSTTLILGRINSSDDNQAMIKDENKQITQSEISINSSLVSTYSELIKSKALIKEVKENLNTDLSEAELRKSISVSRVSDTELIEITVTNIDANIASLVANEIAKVFGNKIEEIYKISNVYIIDEAISASEPYNINHVRDIAVFAAIGLIISIGYTVLYNLLDTTIKTSSDMEKITNVKNLISIPYNKNEKSELITYEDSKSIVSEAFKTLRTNVQFSSINDKKTKTYLVTSCFQSEGKSYVAANLAVTFAQVGKKVILIDSDMRRGRQAKVFNFPNECGLSNYISNIDPNGMEINYGITQFIKETGINNLNIITSGNVPPNPSELLASSRVHDLIKELKAYYDVIIFDGAPVLPITDSLILARLLDSTILVARYNKTKKDDLAKAKSDIENVGGKIIGTCLNAVAWNNGSNDANYYYYYGLDEEKTLKEKIQEKFKNISTAIFKIKKLSKVNKSKKIRIIDEVKSKKKPVVKEAKRDNIDIVNTVIKEANKNNYYEEAILASNLEHSDELLNEKELFEESKRKEEQRKIEEKRRQEELRKAEEQIKFEEARRQEELRKAEEQRIIEEARIQEELRKAEEQRRLEEVRKAEEQRKLEEERRQEELRKAEEQRRLEEARRQEELRKAEEQRRLEEARRQEELRKAEEQRRLEEERRQEELRKKEEQRRLEEERRQEELRKKEEQRRQEELRKKEEQRRLEEERRQEELRKKEEQRRLEEERRQEELRKKEELRLQKEEEKRKRKEAREQKIKDTIDGVKSKAKNAKAKIEKEREERRIKKAEKKIKAMEEQAKQVKEKLQKAEEERNKMFGKRIMFEIDGDEIDEIVDLSTKNGVDRTVSSNERRKLDKKEIIKNNENKVEDDLYPKIK